jgi:ribosome maturation factor RimP
MPGGQRHAPQSRHEPKREPKHESRQQPRREPRNDSPGGRPDESSIADVIRPAVNAAGMDLESVRVTAAGRRRLLRVIVDSDGGVSLDDAADVSRDLSAALDATDVMGDQPYTLEVSSPGVDRPLTEPRHWRRAAGRLVEVTVTGTGSVSGRVVEADEDGVTLDIGGDPENRRHFAYAGLGAGTVQIEFGRLQDELGA